MRNFLLGLVLGISLIGNAVQAYGISLEGVSSRATIAAVLMSGTQSNVDNALKIADMLLRVR